MKEWMKQRGVRAGVWMRGHRMMTVLLATLLLAIVPSTYLLSQHFAECPDKKFQVGYNEGRNECFCENTLSASKLNTFLSQGFEMGSKHGGQELFLGANATDSFHAWAAAEGLTLPTLHVAGSSWEYELKEFVVVIPLSFFDPLTTGTRIVELDYESMPFLVKFRKGPTQNSYDVDVDQLTFTRSQQIFDFEMNMVAASSFFCPEFPMDMAEDASVVGNVKGDAYDGPCGDLVPSRNEYINYNITKNYLYSYMDVDPTATTAAEWDMMRALHDAMRDYTVEHLKTVFSTDAVAYCIPNHCVEADCFGFELFKVIFLIASATSVCFTVSQLLYLALQCHVFPLFEDVPDTTISTAAESKEMQVLYA